MRCSCHVQHTQCPDGPGPTTSKSTWPSQYVFCIKGMMACGSSSRQPALVTHHVRIVVAAFQGVCRFGASLGPWCHGNCLCPQYTRAGAVLHHQGSTKHLVTLYHSLSHQLSPGHIRHHPVPRRQRECVYTRVAVLELQSVVPGASTSSLLILVHYTRRHQLHDISLLLCNPLCC